jgi:ribosome-associated protein
MKKKNTLPKITIPENELEFDFIRAKGKGGENVNRRSTKVQLHWSIGNSKIFDEKKKKLLRKVLGDKVTHEDKVIFSVCEERMQGQNRKIAVERLNNLIRKALKPKIKRIPTEPTKISIDKRIKEKKELSEKKKIRKINYSLEEI